MTRRTTIVVFYSGVALISVGILAIAFYLRSQLPKPEMPVIHQGKAQLPSWFPITEDFSGINQEGKPVRLSDLKGKVWLVAEFFAVCPHCAVRNGEELHKIADAFRDQPDFHIVCISVDPENDQPGKLKDYASALNADANRWWFVSGGEVAKTHAYLEQVLKFFGIRERRDPADVEANGRYQHDLGFLLVDRDFRVVGKWPLADARSELAKQQDPELYERLKQELYARIRTELSRPKP